MYGIGVDLVRIDRLDPARLSSHALSRMFHPDELSALPSEPHRAMEYLASRFAAKEAFSKALGSGFRGFGPSDIRTLRDEKGKPVLTVSEKVRNLLPSGDVRIHVSLSHEREVAVASVVIEVL